MTVDWTFSVSWRSYVQWKFSLLKLENVPTTKQEWINWNNIDFTPEYFSWRWMWMPRCIPIDKSTNQQHRRNTHNMFRWNSIMKLYSYIDDPIPLNQRYLHSQTKKVGQTVLSVSFVDDILYISNPIGYISSQALRAKQQGNVFSPIIPPQIVRWRMRPHSKSPF